MLRFRALTAGVDRRDPWRYAVPLAQFALLATVSACRPIEVPPCVTGTGVDVGDTLGLTVVEPYDASSSYRYDLEAFFGADRDYLSFPQCNPEHDITYGEELTLDLIGWLGEDDETGCKHLAGSLRDSQKVAFGRAEEVPAAGRGKEFVSVSHRRATIAGCESAHWQGLVIARVDRTISPLAPLAPGELPSALLWRALSSKPFDPACDSIDWGFYCLFVVELERR